MSEELFRELIQDGHTAKELSQVFGKYLKAEEDRRAQEVAKHYEQGSLFDTEKEE